MTTRLLVLKAYLASTLLVACGREAPPTDALVFHEPPGSARAAEEAPADVGQQAQVVSQKLVRRGRLELEVKSVDQALKRIEPLATEYKALLSDASIIQDDGGYRRASLTLRVPTDRFRDALDALKELGTTRQETISTDDVTKSYVDIETRLAVMHETEGRLRSLLATRTGTLADVLAVERELGRIRGEIEGLEGQRRYYDQLIALSTIDIAMYEPEAMLRPGALAPIRSAFRESLGLFASSLSALIRIVVLVVPWALVGALIWIVVRRVRRAAKKSAAA